MEKKTDTSSFIYSYLPFSDDRVQFLDIRGWDGQAIKLNREYYMNFIRSGSKLESSFTSEKINDIICEIIERTEDVDGIYILIGEDLENYKEGISYVGETGDFKRRMREHFGGKKELGEEDYIKSKEFCSDIFFFSQRGKLGGAGLGESLRKAIEAKIIQEALKSDAFQIVNRDTTYNGKLNLSDKDLLNQFFEKIKIILEHLGVPLFKQKIEVKTNDYDNLFICTERDTMAEMYKGETGYVVLKGSKIYTEQADYMERKYGTIYRQRHKLKEQDLLTPIDGGKFMELKKDQEFTSSSSAATFVLGRSANGYITWKKKDDPGITFGEYLESEEAQEE